jgi:calcineurin-like phosphoesterase family protein
MTTIYFSADMHLNHANIIKYCNRPFYKKGDLLGTGDISRRPWTSDKIKKDRAYWMDRTLIDNWNQTVSYDDIVYHLGDFAYGSKETIKEYEKQLSGKIIHIKGNHDRQNKMHECIDKCMMGFGGKTVFAQHHPPEIMPTECDFVICGHIHDHWKHKIYKKYPNIPVINVGVDVWSYKPVSINSLLKYYNLIKNNLVDEMGNRV